MRDAYDTDGTRGRDRSRVGWASRHNDSVRCGAVIHYLCAVPQPTVCHRHRRGGLPRNGSHVVVIRRHPTVTEAIWYPSSATQRTPQHPTPWSTTVAPRDAPGHPVSGQDDAARRNSGVDVRAVRIACRAWRTTIGTVSLLRHRANPSPYAVRCFLQSCLRDWRKQRIAYGGSDPLLGDGITNTLNGATQRRACLAMISSSVSTEFWGASDSLPGARLTLDVTCASGALPRCSFDASDAHALDVNAGIAPRRAVVPRERR